MLFSFCQRADGLAIGICVCVIALQIDVTGLTPGTYTMRLEVNKARVLPEADYTNNVAEFPIVVPADSDLPPPVNPAGCPQHGGCSSCSNSRGCGWCASMG